MRQTLFEIYWRLRRVIAPTLKYSQYTYEEALRRYIPAGARWVDIGCGHSLLPAWRAQEERALTARAQTLVGIDYDLDALKSHPSISWRTRGDITRLPFRNGSFDVATANMVVEHLDDPDTQFLEIGRVLKPGGLFVFHTPNARGYGVLLGRVMPEAIKVWLARLLQGRRSHDVFTTYYRANTEARVKELAERSGFEVRDVQLFVSDAVFAMVPPLAILELIWLRLMMTAPFRLWRTNMIGVLQKRG